MKQVYRSRRLEIATGLGCAFKVSTDGDSRALVLYAHPFLVAVFCTIPWPWRNLRKESREWGVSFHDWSMWWSWANPTMEWKRSDPWWMRFSINFPHLLFGKMKYEMVEGEKRELVVPMPEGSYPATIQKQTRTWTRSRLPLWRRVRVDWSIEIPGGIPFSGKGENSWDCGDDGLWGTGGDSPEGAVANAVKSVLRNRMRYGETAETRGRVVMARKPKVPHA